MIDKKSLIIFGMMFLMMVSFIVAQPPFIQEPQILDNNLVLETNLIQQHPINTEFYLHTHVYYKENGLRVDPLNLLCYYHLYDSNINWEHKDIGVLAPYGSGLYTIIEEGNFTEIGLYSVLFWCETDEVESIGGFTQFTFNVYETDNIKQKFDLSSNVLYFILGLGIVLIILSFVTKEMFFGLIGSFVFLLTGIYLIPILLIFGVIIVISSLLLGFYFVSR